MNLAHVIIDTPIGPLTLVATDTGMREIRFPDESLAGPDDGPNDPAHPVLVEAARQLGQYFDGDRLEFDLPLEPLRTVFQRHAWGGLATIPFGATISYSEQARLLGHPGNARAVGAANSRNPLPILVPCHRVVGSDGSLTGFGGGIETKAWLLHHERQVLGLELKL